MSDRRDYKREYMADYRKGKRRGKTLGGKPNPKLDPDMRERHTVVWQMIRAGEIDGLLGLSYIVWPPVVDDPTAGTVARDKSRRAA